MAEACHFVRDGTFYCDAKLAILDLGILLVAAHS